MWLKDTVVRYRRKRQITLKSSFRLEWPFRLRLCPYINSWVGLPWSVAAGLLCLTSFMRLSPPTGGQRAVWRRPCCLTSGVSCRCGSESPCTLTLPQCHLFSQGCRFWPERRPSTGILKATMTRVWMWRLPFCPHLHRLLYGHCRSRLTFVEGRQVKSAWLDCINPAWCQKAYSSIDFRSKWFSFAHKIQIQAVFLCVIILILFPVIQKQFIFLLVTWFVCHYSCMMTNVLCFMTKPAHFSALWH